MSDKELKEKLRALLDEYEVSLPGSFSDYNELRDTVIANVRQLLNEIAMENV